MNYVVLVLEPLPSDLPEVAEKVAAGLPIPPDKVLKLLERAPGPVTRPVPERDARKVQRVMLAAGLVVEVREGNATGPAVEFEPEASITDTWAALEAAVNEAAAEAAAAEAAAAEEAGGGKAPGDEAGGDGAWGDEVAGDEAGSDEAGRDEGATADGSVAAAEGRNPRRTQDRDPRRTEDRGRAAPVAGQTTVAPPRDPAFTTLVREPPALERTGLRRRIASAATMPALLTLLVALLAVAVTVLPILRQQEQQRVAGVAEAVAATVEGLSGGLPLSAPILRLELNAAQARGAATLPGRGVDYLLLVDGDQAPVLAWYRGRAGIDAFPEAVRVAAMDRAKATLDGSATAEDATAGDWVGNLSASWRDLTALVGLGTLEPTMAAAPVHRQGVVSAALVAGGEPTGLRQFGRALLTALLVGLVPVLFGVLAVLSLTRGLRQSINYLLVAADRISHGDFEQSVELDRDDELGQIAAAVERMRISLREVMERLRRRR
ncbi:MAG: HAMP domain-containing protein [Trueperaceae bacterium]